MTALKPTAGKWSGRPDHDPILLKGCDEAGLSIAFACGGGDPRREEYVANARLIAETGDVLHETGMTPRQLANQRGELLASLRWYVETDEVSDSPGNEYWIEGKRRAEDIISKCEATT